MDIGQHHSNFFAAVLSDPQMTAELLYMLFDREQRDLVNFSSLKQESDLVIDPGLTAHLTDLFYTLKTRSGKPEFLYVVFEHKANRKSKTPIQILRYNTKKYWLFTKPAPIVTVLFYHGKATWNAPRNFHAYLKMDERFKKAFGKHVMDFEPFYLSLKNLDLSVLKVSLKFRVFLHILKHIHDLSDKNELIKLIELAKPLWEKESNHNFLEYLISYIYRVHSYSREELKDLIEQHAGTGRGEIVMTTFEKIMSQGRKEGREEGRDEGRYQQNLETAKIMYELSYSLLEITKITGLDEATLKKEKIIA